MRVRIRWSIFFFAILRRKKYAGVKSRQGTRLEIHKLRIGRPNKEMFNYLKLYATTTTITTIAV